MMDDIAGLENADLEKAVHFHPSFYSRTFSAPPVLPLSLPAAKLIRCKNAKVICVPTCFTTLNIIT